MQREPDVGDVEARPPGSAQRSSILAFRYDSPADPRMHSGFAEDAANKSRPRALARTQHQEKIDDEVVTPIGKYAETDIEMGHLAPSAERVGDPRAE